MIIGLLIGLLNKSIKNQTSFIRNWTLFDKIHLVKTLDERPNDQMDIYLRTEALSTKIEMSEKMMDIFQVDIHLNKKKQF